MISEKISFLILFQFFTFNLTGQCGEDLSIILSTQSEIDNFIDNYCIEFEGNLQISDDNNGEDDIINLDSLLTLKRVNGIFQISNNSLLENLNGLDSISHLGALRIVNNSSIINLEGLNSFNSVNGDIIIKQNKNLINLNALNSLSTMQSSGGYIEITDNDNLLDITGLSTLSSIVSGLIIRDNEELTSLNGLQNLSIKINSDSPIAEDLEIVNNLVLSDCSIESICEALNSEDTTFDIQNNGINCETNDEIISNCTTSTIDFENLKLKIFPNPIINQITIDSPNIESLIIYNSIGHLMKRIQLEKGINNFDFLQFENGVYFLKTTNGVVHQLIKL